MPGILRPLFRWNFWFETIPVPFTQWVACLIFWFMSVLLVGGIILFFLASFAHKSSYLRSRLEKFHRQILRRISGLTVTAGFFGLLWYWFTQARVPVFGMRIFLLLWVVIFGGWAWYLIGSIQRKREIRAQAKAKESYEKWLPKPRRK